MKCALYGLLFPSGKWYWGQGDYKKRWSKYKTLNCKDQPELYNALKCYGWDNVEKYLYPMPKDIAVQLEPMIIRFYDSFHNGYNGSEGGECGSIGHKRSAEANERIRQAHIGSKRSDETKYRMRMAQLGRKKGKMSDAHRLAISRSKIGHKHSEETKMKMSKAKIGNTNRRLR